MTNIKRNKILMNKCIKVCSNQKKYNFDNQKKYNNYNNKEKSKDYSIKFDERAVFDKLEYTPLESAEYILDMLVGLQDIAEKSNFRLLAYLLELASQEAATQRNKLS